MKQQDEKKLHIIRKGLKALYLKGYNATGVKEITDAADIPKGSFYNYFSTKEDFAVEAMRYFTTRELEVIEDFLADQSVPPLQRIKNLYRFKIEHFVEKGTYSLGCFLCNITLEMADVSQHIANTATQLFHSEDVPLIDCLKEAQANNELAATIDINELAVLIRNSWLGALVIMKANKSPEPLYNFHKILNNLILA